MTGEQSPKIEYRVRPVTRYIVTRFEEWAGRQGNDGPARSSVIGEYDNADIAYQVGYACAKTEHDRLGYPPGDERIVYPEHPMAMQAQAMKQTEVMSRAADERVRQAVFMTANGPQAYDPAKHDAIGWL